MLSDRSVFIAWERGGCGKILGRSLDFMKNMGVGGGGGREGSSHRCEPSRGGEGGITRYIGSVLGLEVNSLPNGPFKSNIYVYFDSSSEV